MTGMTTVQRQPAQVTPTDASWAAGGQQAGVARSGLAKAHTGIVGFDEITGGGLPAGRPCLVTGPAGCGKTLFGVQFLVQGVREGEAGVLLTFEESAPKVAENVASLGFDLHAMQRDGQLAIESFQVDPSLIVETGEYDLEGLFVLLGAAVDRVGARRVVIDTIEVLFGAFSNEGLIRAELGRLFRWVEERQLTAVITGERGEHTLTRHGIEEYVSDCVIVLDHRVREAVSTRRLRVMKYRGSGHGTNEYPFLITEGGIVVLPITSVALDYPASTQRLSTGVPRLDHMLGGGVFQGSTVLISGNAGNGKTTLAAQVAHAACQRGQRVLYLSFEESPEHLIRNMRSVGIDLGQWVDAGLLRCAAASPAAFGLESHLLSLYRLVEEHQPALAVLDPLTGFLHVAPPGEVTSIASRQMDLLKSRGITCVMTALGHSEETSEVAISSMVDTWLLLRNLETNGERNRLLFVMKSRGTNHSNQVREFRLTDAGIDLVDVYVGEEGVLTGSARLSQEARLRDAEQQRRAQRLVQQGKMRHQARDIRAQINALEDQLADVQAEQGRLDTQTARGDVTAQADLVATAAQRWADPADQAQETGVPR